MDTETTKEDLTASIEFDLEEIAEDDDLDGIGGLCEQIQINYRSLAICELLSDVSTDIFYHHLIRSGHTRLYHLSRLRAERRAANPRLMASRNEPFLDAVAANQFKLAADIAALTEKRWWQEDEYEDDFYYAHFLNCLVASDPRMKVESEHAIKKYEAVCGGDGARIGICTALLTKDNSLFNSAFEQLLDERTDQVEREAETALGEELSFQMERHVFIEGLALLRIADKLHFATQEEYLYCPVVARLPMRAPFPDDGYPTKAV